MINLSLTKAKQIVSSDSSVNAVEFTGVSIDARQIKPGNLFVALNGERVDGHDFLSQAKHNGAVAALVNRPVAIDLPQLVVTNTAIALARLATYWRQQFSIAVIGITGSCGKTSTKQMLAAICEQAGQTLASRGNQNNQLGVPLTLCQLNASHRYAVIEMGTDHPGEIALLRDMAQPQVAMITNITSVHVEPGNHQRFQNVEAIFAEKSTIFDKLDKQGCAILNADDAFYRQWQQRLLNTPQLTFGFSKQAQVSAQHLQADAKQYYQFDLHSPVGNIDIHLSIMGKHNVENALAASAAAIAIGVDLATIKMGLANIAPSDRRMRQYPALNGACVIDDSYNANIKSVPAVIEMLAQYTGKRIMVLGDMREVGADSAEQHARMGRLAKDLRIDYFYACGEQTRHTIMAFGERGIHFNDQQTLIDKLQTQLDANTTVLVKGSSGMAMDAVVNAIKSTNECYYG